jgi:hypothetical protein
MNVRVLGSGPVIVAILIALIVTIGWAAGSPIDTPYSMANSQWNGSSALSALGFESVSADLSKTLTSAQSPAVLLLLGPTQSYSAAETASIQAFVSRGGVLVLADAFGAVNSLLQLLGVPARFDGRVLIDTLFYSKQPTYPIALRFEPSYLTNDITRLVLSYATVLTVQPQSTLTVLASSTPFSFLDTNNNGKKDVGEPSGPFPVLAEMTMGRGSIILFSSPDSFTNSLLNEGDNAVLLRNLIASRIQPGRSIGLLLDETHLDVTAFTAMKLAFRDFATSIFAGGMSEIGKFALTTLTLGIIMARFTYLRPAESAPQFTESEEQDVRTRLDIDGVSQRHPTWNRRSLEYVAHELSESLRLRRIYEEE